MMARFHDEFFKKGSKAEDKLVLKCISSEGIKKISDAVNTSKQEKVWICAPSINHCKLGGEGKKLAWRALPICGFQCSYYVCGKTDPNEIDKQGYVVDAILNYDNCSYSTEVEVLCSRNEFIIGYADILFTPVGSIKAKLGEDWSWDNYSALPVILVECKPEIKEIAPVLRQLKTYMHLKHIEHGVIATYSELDSATIELLKREGITVVKFDSSEFVPPVPEKIEGVE